MLKLIGCSLIISAAALFGLNKINTFKKRVNGLKYMIELLSALKIKINYESSAVPVILKELTNKAQNTYFLKSCIELLNKGKSLNYAWNKSVDDYSSNYHLSKKDVQILKDFSIGLGESDVEGQITNIQLYIELINKNLKEAEEKLSENSRISISCSIFGGLILSILLF